MNFVDAQHMEMKREREVRDMCLQMSAFRVCSSKMLNKLFHHYVTMVKECNNIITTSVPANRPFAGVGHMTYPPLNSRPGTL